MLLPPLHDDQILLASTKYSSFVIATIAYSPDPACRPEAVYGRFMGNEYPFAMHPSQLLEHRSIGTCNAVSNSDQKRLCTCPVLYMPFRFETTTNKPPCNRTGILYARLNDCTTERRHRHSAAYSYF